MLYRGEAKQSHTKRLSRRALRKTIVPILALCATGAAAQRIERAPDSAVIEHVRVRPEQNELQLQITVSRPVEPEVMTLMHPDRLVLDFKDTTTGKQPRRVEVNKGGVGAIRLGQNDSIPPTTRIVLDLSSPRNYKLLRDRNLVTVELSADATHRSGEGSESGLRLQSLALPSPTSFGGDKRDPKPNYAGLETDKSPSPEKLLSALPYEPQGNGPTLEPVSAPKEQSLKASAAEVPPVPKVNALEVQPPLFSPLLAAPGTAMRPAEPYSVSAGNYSTQAVDNAPSDNPAVLAAPQSNDKAGKGAEDMSSGGDLPSPRTTAQVPNAKYIIGPDDVLEVDVWRQKDVSRVVTVRPDGKISLPLLGDLQAGGFTPVQLQAKLAEAFRTYYEHPDVTVIVQKAQSHWFNVVGEVTKPGSYPLAQPLTVLDALAAAGGFRDFAKKTKIYVLRVNSDGSHERLPFNYKQVIKGKDLAQNVRLQSGDTVVVP